VNRRTPMARELWLGLETPHRFTYRHISFTQQHTTALLTRALVRRVMAVLSPLMLKIPFSRPVLGRDT